MTGDELLEVISDSFEDWLRLTGADFSDEPLTVAVLRAGYIQGYCTAVLDTVEIFKQKRVKDE